MIPEKTVHQRIRLVVAPAAQSSTIAGDSSVPQPATAAPSIDDHVSSAQTLSANARVQLGGATAEVSTACVHSDSCTCLATARSNNTGVLTHACLGCRPLLQVPRSCTCRARTPFRRSSSPLCTSNRCAVQHSEDVGLDQHLSQQCLLTPMHPVPRATRASPISLFARYRL